MMTENEKAARNKRIQHVIFIIVLALLFVAFIAPFLLVVINVFKSKGDITSDPLAISLHFPRTGSGVFSTLYKYAFLVSKQTPINTGGKIFSFTFNISERVVY